MSISNMNSEYLETILGIDLGTTSVKLSLINSGNREVLYTVSQSTAAQAVGVEYPSSSNEQNVTKIFKTILHCLQQLGQFYSATKRVCKLKAIGITGQMHGIVFWKCNLKVEDILVEKEGDDENGTNGDKKFSNLFTWQDGRCSPEFLAKLPCPDPHLRLATGHGCATAFWLQKHYPEYFQRFDRAGTVMDLFVTVLCGRGSPVMSTQNAASWGYFNCNSRSWNYDILSQAGFPVHLLPEVQDPGTVVGQTRECSWCDGIIPEGVDVGVGMGDLPCTILPVLQTPSDGVISISTSAQIVTTTPAGFTPPRSDPSSPIEFFPFFNGTFLSVAAALTGGNVLAQLVTTLQDWLRQLDVTQATDRDHLFSKLIEMGLNCKDTTLEIDPVLGGERHQPDRRGTVSNIGFENLSLGEVFRVTCRGIARNLGTMAPPEEMSTKGVTRIVGCGSALLRNPVLKQEIEKVFQDLPFVYSDRGDASLGAAIAMCRNQEQINK